MKYTYENAVHINMSIVKLLARRERWISYGERQINRETTINNQGFRGPLTELACNSTISNVNAENTTEISLNENSLEPTMSFHIPMRKK